MATPAFSASATCLAKLPRPKCDGNTVGGERSSALVPLPSCDGTITAAGDTPDQAASTDSTSSGSARGISAGIRSSASTPSLAQMRDATSTDWLSEYCSRSTMVDQPFSLAQSRASGSLLTT